MEIRVNYEHSLASAPKEFIVHVPSRVITDVPVNVPGALLPEPYIPPRRSVAAPRWAIVDNIGAVTWTDSLWGVIVLFVQIMVLS